jgi:hypothetical protein
MLRISLRKCLLLIACTALCVALGIRQFFRPPVYLHVYGTNVSDEHFRSVADVRLTNYLGVRWDLAASIDVHPGTPFGVRSPNRRQPFIDIRGLVFSNCERPLNRILHGLVFSRVLFPRIQEFNHGKFKAFLSC